MSQGGEVSSQNKRPKRTYRACYPCRSRKLKCCFGDPNSPWEGPCERCLREQRHCVRALAPAIRDNTNQSTETLDHSKSEATRSSGHSVLHSNPSSEMSSDQLEKSTAVDHTRSGEEEEDAQGNGDDALVSTNIQNPSDALKLLAITSSRLHPTDVSNSQLCEENNGSASNASSSWNSWAPIQQGSLSVHEARALLSFFEIEMAPLYPVVSPVLFQSNQLDYLIKKEFLLLGCMLAITARFSNIFGNQRGREVHIRLSQWIRYHLMRLMDGDLPLRSIATVEALLLLSEWPLLAMPNHQDRTSRPEEPSEETALLRPSLRYEAYSWNNIGTAVRLAQELGLQHIGTHSSSEKAASAEDWRTTRSVRTWAYCYHADRHVSARLGRSAALQPFVSYLWWDQVSSLIRKPGPGDEGSSDVFIHSSTATLLGSIQEQLYPHPDVTQSLLRTGTWETFLRSLQLEMRSIKRTCRSKLQENTAQSALLQIELNYLVLYANSLALRALQEKIRRRRQAKDTLYCSPSLLNLVEGPWILEASAAARSIVESTLDVLVEQRILRFCPARIFQQIVFAATFLYKALATGVIEHGRRNVIELLDQVVAALGNAPVDGDHCLKGFAILLTRLGDHWKTLSSKTVFSPSILMRDEQADEPGGQRPCTAATISDNNEAVLGPSLKPSFASQIPPLQLPTTPPSHTEFVDLDFDSTAMPPYSDTTSFSTVFDSDPNLLSMFLDSDISPFTPFDANTDANAGIGSWPTDPTFFEDADRKQNDMFRAMWDNSDQNNIMTDSNPYAMLLGTLDGL